MRKAILRSVFLLVLPLTTLQGGEVLFREDFNEPELDMEKWATGSWKLGRSMVNLKPEVKNGIAHLKVQNWNANVPSSRINLAGTEIYTRQQFARGEGLEFEARVRFPKAPAGLVSSFFTYATKDVDGHRLVDEFDFQMLSTRLKEAGSEMTPLLLTTWHDWNASRQDHAERQQHQPKEILLSGFDPAAWNVIKLRWLPDRVEWWANGKLLFTNSEIVPDHPTPVRLNFWVADSTWEDAYDEAIKPAGTEGEQMTWTFDVDYVSVSRP